MSYDERCYRLAEYFLEDVPVINSPHHADRLAQTIQDIVEQYLADESEEEAQRLAEPPYDTREEKEGLR